MAYNHRMTDTRRVDSTLSKAGVHAEWEDDYRTLANARFYDAAINYIAEELKNGDHPTLLDAGCGICDYAVRLARRGFQVTGVDFSQPVIAKALANVTLNQLEEAITVRQANLLDLPFEDATFDAVFCWGVLMHIPDIETATAELSRVLKPGGRLALCEMNMSSVDAAVMGFLPKHGKVLKRTKAGIEHWKKTEAGDLMTRVSDVRWLIHRFEDLGFELRKRRAGQFSEAYVRMPSPATKKLVHNFNQFWFDWIGLARPALSNILIFEKR